MRKLLLSATVLTPFVFLAGAHAQNLDGGVDLDLDGGIDADADMGNGGMDADADAGADADADADIDLDPDDNMDADANVDADVDGMVVIVTDDGEAMAMTEAELEGQTVVSADGETIGTVTDVAASANGGSTLIIDLDEDFAGVTGRVRINASSVVQSDGGLQAQMDAEEVRTRIAQQSEARSGDDVCFFADANLAGDSFCIGVGANFATMPEGWNDTVSSITVGEGVTLTVCENDSYGGWCETFTTNVEALDEERNDMISSFRVR